MRFLQSVYNNPTPLSLLYSLSLAQRQLISATLILAKNEDIHLKLSGYDCRILSDCFGSHLSWSDLTSPQNNQRAVHRAPSEQFIIVIST